MNEVRCPDCGYRLKTSECPICLKRVPFPKTAVQKSPGVQKTGPRVKVSFPKAAPNRKNRAAGRKLKIFWTVIALVAAFAPLVGELMDVITPPQPEPVREGYYEDYLPAGAEGAGHIPTIETQTLYDGQGILVTADTMGLLYDTPAVMMTVSNASEKDVSVSVSATAVNGYMMNYSGMYEEVPAGESVKTCLWLDGNDLQSAGIETVAELVLQLEIYDANDYEEIASGVRVTLQTSAAGLVQEIDDRGKTVYDDGGVRLIFRLAQVDEYGDVEFRFFAENLTGDTVYIGADSLLVNGKEADSMLWCHLWPGTRCIDSVFLYEADQYGIAETGDLKQLQLELYVESGETDQRQNKTVLIDIGK